MNSVWTFFNDYSLLLIETVAAIVLWVVLRLVLGQIVKKRLRSSDFSEIRKRMAMKSVNSILNIVFISALITVWSVEQSQILVFLSSVMTVLGVAFFAQWSHLSNITSGIIIFFNTGTKIGDEIQIMDKEFDIKGEIFDIGIMFFKIRTRDNEIISIPNNVILQKAIKTTDSALIHEIEEIEEGNIDD